MARLKATTPVHTDDERKVSFSSLLTLTFWQLHRSKFLLSITLLGIIAAVVIACAVPLFLTITTTAGLRNTLGGQPYSAQVNCDIAPLGLSSHSIHDIQHQLDPFFQHSLGQYLDGPPQFTISSENFNLFSPRLPIANKFHALSVPIKDAASHLKLEQGKIPHITSTPGSEIEIMITPDTAQGLHLHLGSVMELEFPFYTQFPDPFVSNGFNQNKITVRFKVRIAGLFTIDETNLNYWHGSNFQPYSVLEDPIRKLIVYHYSMLFPLEGLLGLYDALGAKYHVATPLTLSGNILSWYYTLNTLSISTTQINDLIKRLADLNSTITIHYANAVGAYSFNYDPTNPPPYPYIVQTNLYSPLLSLSGTPSTLEQYRSGVEVMSVPIFIVALQIDALILFFVSLMINLLVERQSDAIAILRSRGASRRQIFGMLFLQTVSLSIIAIIIGIPLSLLMIVFVAQHILPIEVQDALNSVTVNPIQVLLSTFSYAAAVVFVLLVTMSFSFIRAASMDVLSLRRSMSRSIRLPLWQRLHLDILVAILALGAYIISLYLSMVGTLLDSTTKARVVVPLSLIAPFFLVIGCLLLFLRFFPVLLGLGAWFVTRGRSVALMLALAQMARVPHQAIRMTLLLTLATAFALFSLIFMSSQEQRINDAAAYQTEADFSGSIPDHSYQQSLENWTTHYKTIPGVTSASVGYVSTGDVAGGSHFSIQGVDTSTFADTALWPQESSLPSLVSLMNLLARKRQYGSSHGIVPVLVDRMVSNTLSIHVGSIFHMTVEDNTLIVSDVPCLVVGIIQHIPTLSINQQLTSTVGSTISAGILLDYRTYSAVYIQEVQKLVGQSNGSFSPNYVWLRTKDDASSLTLVRSALDNASFYLSNVKDRRAIINHLQADPLTISLIGMLTIGMFTTLLLTIIGDLLSSWLNAQTRRTNFAVLRALGTSPRQLMSVLIWEQTLIYVIGLLLGVIFGALLSITVVPTLIFNNTGGQSGLPTQIIVPSTLTTALLCVIIIFIVALGIMVYVVSKPSLSQTLRLNED